MIIFFFFGTIGITLFGGAVNSTTPDFYKQKVGSDLPTGYWFLNFNDFPNAILVLYVNVINNNWVFITNMLCLSKDDSRTIFKWYFVIFQLIVNLFIMNILVGFIIDNIMTNFDLYISEEEQKANIEAELQQVDKEDLEKKKKEEAEKNKTLVKSNSGMFMRMVNGIFRYKQHNKIEQNLQHDNNNNQDGHDSFKKLRHASSYEITDHTLMATLAVPKNDNDTSKASLLMNQDEYTQDTHNHNHGGLYKMSSCDNVINHSLPLNKSLPKSNSYIKIDTIKERDED